MRIFRQRYHKESARFIQQKSDNNDGNKGQQMGQKSDADILTMLATLIPHVQTNYRKDLHPCHAFKMSLYNKLTSSGTLLCLTIFSISNSFSHDAIY